MARINEVEKFCVTDTVLGTRELGAKLGGGLRGSVKLPSWDVYQGFLDHEAEGLGKKRKKAKRKRKKDPPPQKRREKKKIWHF